MNFEPTRRRRSVNFIVEMAIAVFISSRVVGSHRAGGGSWPMLAVLAALERLRRS